MLAAACDCLFNDACFCNFAKIKCGKHEFSITQNHIHVGLSRIDLWRSSVSLNRSDARNISTIVLAQFESRFVCGIGHEFVPFHCLPLLCSFVICTMVLLRPPRACPFHFRVDSSAFWTSEHLCILACSWQYGNWSPLSFANRNIIFTKKYKTFPSFSGIFISDPYPDASELVPLSPTHLLTRMRLPLQRCHLGCSLKCRLTPRLFLRIEK